VRARAERRGADPVIERPKPFRREGLGYVYEPVGAEGEMLGVSLKIDSLRRRGVDIVGEVLVETTLPGVPGHLVQTVQNISGAEARAKFARVLEAKTRGVPLDWAGIVEAFCVGVLRADREGTPFVKVGDLPDDTGEVADTVRHLVQTGRINEVHGPGGDGKGWLATFVSACVQSGVDLAHLRVQQANVLYLDWEDDGYTLNRRLKAAAKGLGLPPVRIDYRQCHGALKEQVLQVARHTSAEQVGLIIVDSVELACGASSEHGTYQERAEGLFEALRAVQTGVTWPVSVLLIDHVSDEARRSERGVSKAYGSVFKANWVRNAWELRKDQDHGSPSACLGLFQFKANHSSRVAPIGLRLDFSRWPQAVSIEEADVKDSSELSKKMTNGARILAVMGTEPLGAAEIADMTGIGPSSVRTELARMKARGVVAQTTDGRWQRHGATAWSPPPWVPEVDDPEIDPGLPF
jgi:hypothetical protein